MHAYLTDHHLAVLVLVQVNVELRMLLLHKVKIALGCAVYRYRRAAQMRYRGKDARINIRH